MVNADKTLYVDNLRSAVSTDTYVMRGDKREVWEPKFTFHGFRYVEVSGCPVPPKLGNVTGVVLGSDTPRVGDFECSSKLINKIYQNAVWTQRANFIDIPTDCPQRDERLGWTGDAQVFIRTAVCNMDVAAFFTKWMDDLIDAQTPEGAFTNVVPQVLGGPGDAAWGDAGVVCPWTLYQCYEDAELLAKMYPHMKAWVGYLKKTSRKLLRSPELTHCFGDWLSIKANTPKDVIQTAHFAYATDITRKAAEALGKKGDAKRYQTLFADIKSAFNKAFVKSDGKIKGETQTAYLMALKFGLLSPKRTEQAVKHLVADIRAKKHHASTGFVGTALIMSVLCDTGNLGLAYRLLENTTFPSWGYSVVNGATTIWERWNGWTKESGPGDVNMNSYSHYAYGAVVEWMFDTIAGIDHGACGFQNFVLRPQPGGSLKFATASYRSPYGTIRSAWRKRGKQLRYDITIPANTRATVVLPVKNLKRVKLGGKALASCELEVLGDTSFALPAGVYSITW
jgi:alpha-L-rhamnosidase